MHSESGSAEYVDERVDTHQTDCTKQLQQQSKIETREPDDS